MAGVRVIIQFDNVADAEAMAAGMAERCRKVEAEEPGCLQYEVFRSAMNPNRVALLEHWASAELFDKHWALVSGNRPAAPDPNAPPRPTSRAELYHQANYETVDGVWMPSDAEARIQSIRWP